MFVPGRRAWIVLALAFAVAGGAGLAGRYVWGRHHYRAAEEALARRDFREAGLRLDKYLSLRPHDPAARLLAAQAARRRGDYGEALEHLHACEQDGGAATALALERQLLLVQRGDPAEARRLLPSAFARPQAPETPPILEAYLEGSLGAMEDGPPPGAPGPDPEEVQRAVDLWLRLAPGPVDRAQGLAWRGRLKRAGDDPAQALPDFREALELDPDCFEARLHLALALGHEDPREALVHLKRLRERYPENKVVCFSLAAVLRSLNELDEAGRLLDELLASDPDNVSYLVERGYIAMNARQLDDAERWLRRALDLDPRSLDVYLALSGCLFLAGREAEAKRYFDEGNSAAQQARAAARPTGKSAARPQGAPPPSP